MKIRILAGIIFALALGQAWAVTYGWTNTLGGDWFLSSNWSPHGTPKDGDTALITNNGTYTIVIPTNGVTLSRIILGGTSGTQTLVQGSFTALYATNLLDVRSHGILTITNAGFHGVMWVESGGELQLNSASGLQLYSAAITNEGTVTWSSGSLAVGGSNSETSYVTNSGLWVMSGNDGINYGGGTRPVFSNSGVLRKLSGTGQSAMSMDLVNLPPGVVDLQTGTLRLLGFQTNYLGGTFAIASGATLTLSGANFTDAGGVMTGGGTFQFTSGNFYLRTNVIAGLKFASGDVYVVTNTFQQAGAITNLTLDGATLHGTNRVAGTLTITGGNLVDTLTVLPQGQLNLAAPSGILLYSLNLINQGTVNWSNGGLAVGGTPPTSIGNSGLWLMSGDNSLNYGGGLTPWYTNAGTIKKTAGSPLASSSFAGISLLNLSNAPIEVDAGVIVFPTSFTNQTGELRLNGGAFGAAFTGFLNMTGGTLDGTGTVGANSLLGGTISPGLGGPGVISFSQGLNLGSNATLNVEATGTTPGSQYDQLSVTGAVSLANCNLHISLLPNVPVGTAFTLINNDGTDPVLGLFNLLPENSLVTNGAQLFRIHYIGGTGNDVVLVRDSGATNATLHVLGDSYTPGNFRLTGTGASLTVYGIEATTNFIMWTNIGSTTGDLSGSFNFSDTNAAKFKYRYYRATN